LDADLAKDHVNADLAKLGLFIIYSLLGLIAIVLILVAADGAFTYPSEADVARATPDPTKLFDNLALARSTWFSQIKDLLELLVVSLLVPLVATVIGYVFGRRSDAGK
jgi:hypothetical protein